jgi:hypothetical protein
MALRSLRLSPRTLLRFIFVFALAVIFSGTTWLWQHQTQHVPAPVAIMVAYNYTPPAMKAHPIDYLIRKADTQLYKLMSKETKNLTTTAQAYRERRERHPPPGFAEWYKFAEARHVVMVEDLFDQIYYDLKPFWGIDAKRIRQFAKHYPNVISVRNRSASMTTVAENTEKEWMEAWHDLTAKIQEWLPDVDIPINVMDESRVIVPWENITDYVNTERATRKLPSKSAALQRPAGLAGLDTDPGEPIEVQWDGDSPYWDMARVGCSPDTLSREVPAATNLSGPPPMPTGFPTNSFEGYVQNWTMNKDPCSQPELRDSHGTFVEPVSKSTTHQLIPLFGGSKLPMNNDILIPPAFYWADNPLFSTGKRQGMEWEEKKPKVMWRGGATGGRNRENNWTRFQRHRFVAMLNGTAVRAAESNVEGPGIGRNFVLQSDKTYDLQAKQYKDMGLWLDDISDVGIVHLACFPATGNTSCPYTDPYFKVMNPLSLADQFAYKFLPDIDGNSFSGRYRSFLLSTSLPIKATIYSEWHDSRLIPWAHFVPMHNSFVDMYGILDYFVGTGVELKDASGSVFVPNAHDAEARKIAMQGKEWAEQVLRKDDMLVYVMRLLMEYARICDDERERLGWVDDLE